MPVKKIVALIMVFLGIGIIVAFSVISLVNARRPTAGLKVETTPSALVFVDNIQIGQTPIDKTFRPTEVTVKIIPDSTNQNLSTYQTKVRLSNKVYTVIRRDFGTTDKDSSGETVSLLPQSGTSASLAVITSSPEFASVTLDGEPQGFTPLSVASVPPGDHQIVVSAPGYISRTIPAQALSGYKLTLNVKLAANPDSIPSPTPDPQATSSAVISPTSPPTNPSPKVSPTATPTPTPSLPKPYVKILSTPIGFLRVRSGPGTNFSEVGQVKPDELYPLLATQSEWYHIKVDLEATSSGWISSQYGQKYE